MNIVVAFDGSPAARRALRTSLDLANAFAVPAKIHVVSVVDYITLPAGLSEGPPGAPDLLATEAETELNVATEIARTAAQTIIPKLLRGHVVLEVLKYAESVAATFLVAGTHGRKGIRRAVLGSTCEALVRQSDIPVLTVRGITP